MKNWNIVEFEWKHLGSGPRTKDEVTVEDRTGGRDDTAEKRLSREIKANKRS